jgi:hypothetical protein
MFGTNPRKVLNQILSEGALYFGIAVFTVLAFSESLFGFVYVLPIGFWIGFTSLLSIAIFCYLIWQASTIQSSRGITKSFGRLPIGAYGVLLFIALWLLQLAVLMFVFDVVDLAGVFISCMVVTLFYLLALKLPSHKLVVLGVIALSLCEFQSLSVIAQAIWKRAGNWSSLSGVAGLLSHIRFPLFLDQKYHPNLVRFSGIVNNPNEAACVSVCVGLLLVSITSAAFSRRYKSGLMLLIMSALSLYAATLTYSRAGFLAAFIGFSVLLWKGSPVLRLMSGLLAALFFLAILVLPAGVSRARGIYDLNEEPNQHRLAHYQNEWNVAVANCFLGENLGIADSADYEHTLSTEGKIRRFNLSMTWLAIIAEMGVIPLLLLLIGIWNSMRSLVSKADWNQGNVLTQKDFRTGILAAISGMVVFGSVHNIFYFPLLASLLFFLLGIASRNDPDPEQV